MNFHLVLTRVPPCGSTLKRKTWWRTKQIMSAAQWTFHCDQFLACRSRIWFEHTGVLIPEKGQFLQLFSQRSVFQDNLMTVWDNSVIYITNMPSHLAVRYLLCCQHVALHCVFRLSQILGITTDPLNYKWYKEVRLCTKWTFKGIWRAKNGHEQLSATVWFKVVLKEYYGISGNKRICQALHWFLYLWVYNPMLSSV